MSIIVRPACLDDLKQADALIVRSINDLTERHGFGPMASAGPSAFTSFSLRDDPAGLWLAEERGQMRGFAFSWVLGELWFLAQLFVSPDHQAQGLGDQLLKRALDHARNSGATNKALITFAFNKASQGLYIRHGLFPRVPLYFFSVSRQGMPDRLQGDQLDIISLSDTTKHLENLARIDTLSLGVSREKHHKFLLSDPDVRGFALHERGECVGYGYVSSGGHVGPLAVVRADAAAAAFTTGLNCAIAGGSTQLSAFIPGTSEAVLSIAVEHGMRITFPMMLMSAREFGNWTQYLPRNPGFM